MRADKIFSGVIEKGSARIKLLGDSITHGVGGTGFIQNGEPILIDLDTLCVGHPIFEFGSMYNAFLGFSELDHDEIKSFMGYDCETAERFWYMSLKRYLGTDDMERCRELENKARIIGYVRLLRRTIRRADQEGADVKIAHYKKQLLELLDKVDTLIF